MTETDPLRLWSALERTDPKHTKAFTRGGGFRGTAVKPIYCDQRMTEIFGPCGIGWGVTQPNYQLVTGPNGEIAVYCWLSLWFVDPATGARSEPIPGIGGDFAVVKQKDGLRADDEAFKKAATDAIGNAMKHVGMSADIHMGLFEDAKYVSDLRREFADEATNAPAIEPPKREAPKAAAGPASNGAAPPVSGNIDVLIVRFTDGKTEEFPRTLKGVHALLAKLKSATAINAKVMAGEGNQLLLAAIAEKFPHLPSVMDPIAEIRELYCNPLGQRGA